MNIRINALALAALVTLSGLASAQAQAPSTSVAAPATAVSAASAALPVYGHQLFTGQFREQSFAGFNENYLVAVGDRVSLKLWGAVNSDANVAVDAQGNLFIPNVGPVKVLGVRNADLNETVTRAVSRVYKSGVGVYASLATMQPVKLFVTGEVVKPGLYAGVSADSVLKFLDAAGGVAAAGSYVDVKLLRAGKEHTAFDLTRFLREGTLPWVQLNDGDVVLVGSRKPEVSVEGVVAVGARFELSRPGMTAGDVLAMARPQPAANTLLIERSAGAAREKLVFSLAQARTVELQPGDSLKVTSDKHLSQVNVRVEGAHAGSFNLVLPYGASLADALKQVSPDARSSMGDLQLYRQSVAQGQKQAIQKQIEALESVALSTRSTTAEEASLKAKDAELLGRFIEKAKTLVPSGQVLLKGAQAEKILLEEGDVLRVPRQSSLVTVHGDAMFPRAVAWTPGVKVSELIERMGGLSKKESTLQLVRVSLAGEARQVSLGDELQPGDEVFVLPKVESYSVEVARGITQILYQSAVAARVLIGLF